ncbi:hypothetical protein ACIA58_36645 [Kribbella sp. NPDC051586]|uniref:hypothetical protein n=1 Tax=Kribbella sp. NPDC051586 TaxID=3364118 RepID=UPI0037A5ED9E
MTNLAMNKRIRVVTIDDPALTEHDTAGLTGWVHDCGAFVFWLAQPERCGVCWSAGHTRWAFNGQWKKAYIREAS